MCLQIICIICKSECPPLKKITRWGKARKYCSSKCIKTAYRLNHKERDAASKQKWVLNNPEKRKQASKQYQQNNKAYYNSYSALRARHMQNAKLKCLSEWDLFYIDEFYDIAQKRGLEVDHIIPIKHSKVCGLHVPENLQMLTRSENARKSNWFDEDVIAILKV